MSDMNFLDDFINVQGFDEEGEFMPLITIDEEDENQIDDVVGDIVPVLALKNTVLFPGIVIPITVGRDKSIKAIHRAYEDDRLIAVLSQKDSNVEEPSRDDLYSLGTIARIIKLIRMPDGTTTAILQGRKRFRLKEMLTEFPYMEGYISVINYQEAEDALEFKALVSSIMDMAEKIIELSPNIPSEALVMLKNINNPSFLLNFIASNLGNKVTSKQQILEIDDLALKAKTIVQQMDSELQILKLKDKIESKVRVDIEKQQRDYFLNQQLKTIQEELGQSPQDAEIQNMIQRAEKKKWGKNVRQVFDKEINKLRRMNPQVAEFSVQMNYLELLLDLPWSEYTEDNFDLRAVKKVLDADHWGLEKVKERILEHLAVLKLKGDMKAPILCLVGPPGVGKTSLGRSVASALKRKFVRMSLGGLHDESEIRGHRKTYIGAMPGRILQALRKSGSANPVFILDEIDKIGQGLRGDPSSALLEVLDPEQNETFSDNYLEVEFDLSKVLFIATANSMSTIQPALRDRMEVIRISGYSNEEKIEIARKHLVPKQRSAHGLKASHIKLGKTTLQELIRSYTRESGVRTLDRKLAGVMRNVAKKVAMEEPYEPSIKPEQLEDMLGPKPYSREMYEVEKVPGVAVGLAWTSTGGDILFIEASLSKGKGKMTLTGNLGEVMKESASTALSYIRAHSEELGINSTRFEDYDLHIHVPEGAIPKDGPSAGITMLTAMTSAYTEQPVKSYLGMTGEITLRGKVLPVGGIKEKILAAKRAGLKEIVLCSENEKHVREIKEDYIKGLKFHYVSRMSDVIGLAVNA